MRRVERLWDGGSLANSDTLTHSSMERQLAKRYFLFPKPSGFRLRSCLVYLMGTTLLAHVLPTLARVLGLISPTVWRLSTQSLATSPYRWLAASQTWQSLLRLGRTIFGILYNWWAPVDPNSAQSFRQVYLAKVVEWGQRISLQVTRVWETPEIQLIRYTVVRGSDWIIHMLYHRVPHWCQRQWQTIRRAWRIIRYTYHHVLDMETVTLPRSWWTRCRALWITLLLTGSWSVQESPRTLLSSTSTLPSLSVSHYPSAVNFSTSTGTQCPWHRVFGALPYPRTTSTYADLRNDSISHSISPISELHVTREAFGESVISLIETQQEPADLDQSPISDNETAFPSHVFHPLQHLLHTRLSFHPAAWSVWWHWYTGRIESPKLSEVPHSDLPVVRTVTYSPFSLRFQMDQGKPVRGVASPSTASPPSTTKLYPPALNLASPLQSQVCHRSLPPSPPPPVPMSFFLEEFDPSEVSVPTERAERVYYYYYYLAYYQVYHTRAVAHTHSLHYEFPQGRMDTKGGPPLHTALDSEWQALLQDDHFEWGDPSSMWIFWWSWWHDFLDMHQLVRYDPHTYGLALTWPPPDSPVNFSFRHLLQLALALTAKSDPGVPYNAWSLATAGNASWVDKFYKTQDNAWSPPDPVWGNATQWRSQWQIWQSRWWSVSPAHSLTQVSTRSGTRRPPPAPPLSPWIAGTDYRAFKVEAPSSLLLGLLFFRGTILFVLSYRFVRTIVLCLGSFSW
ncbi:hypothetical protein IWQ62_002646 [Dispira parvispora]|uniref:Uncharacterized protein n=1 Tax=Dispira parvispora TaxID=1520584 RepID=A0A9W8ATC9_9FUNG|nr:hypothetical protein IWQ62_002646 [Dispira parvispora]